MFISLWFCFIEKVMDIEKNLKYSKENTTFLSVPSKNKIRPASCISGFLRGLKIPLFAAINLSHFKCQIHFKNKKLQRVFSQDRQQYVPTSHKTWSANFQAAWTDMSQNVSLKCSTAVSHLFVINYSTPRPFHKRVFFQEPALQQEHWIGCRGRVFADCNAHDSFVF